MQGTYTVTAVASQPSRTYPNKHGGNLAVWKLRLKDATPDTPDGLFELHKKEGNDPPRAGDTIEVERSQQGDFSGEPFVRLFLAYNAQGGRGGGSSTPSKGGDDFERRPDHPLNMARALHTSALSSTPAFINQMLAFGFIEAPKDEASYWALVQRVYVHLKGTYPAGVKERAQALASPQGAVQTAQNGQQEIPADTTDLAPAPAGVEDSVPF